MKQSTALSYSPLRLKRTPSPHCTSGSMDVGSRRTAARKSSFTSRNRELKKKRKKECRWICLYAYPSEIIPYLFNHIPEIQSHISHLSYSNSKLETCFSVSSQNYTVEGRPPLSGPWVSHPTLRPLSLNLSKLPKSRFSS